MKPHTTLWPDEEDQAICQRFLQDEGTEGYALCYLFGFYRHAGWSRDAAEALVRQAMATQRGKP